MKSMVWNSFVMAAVILVCAAPAAFAQAIHRVPEGGTDLVYLALAGISCAGAVFYRFRR
jgi:drug/metabolite transporter (DMT)-like permease